MSSNDPMSKLASLSIEEKRRPPTRQGIPKSLIVASTLVLALVVVSVWWYYATTGVDIVSAMTQPPHEVDLMVIPDAPTAQTAAVVLVANGKIVSDLQVKIATKVSGQITELHVEQGDLVEADQVLARIEDITYRAQRDEAAALVERRRAEVQQAEHALERSQRLIDESRARFEFEQRNYERLTRLQESGQANSLEYNNSRNLFEIAQAAHQAAQAQAGSAAAFVNIAKADLKAAESQLRVLQKRLDDCAIRAPIRGIVLERNAQVGDFLAAEGGRGANANAQLVEIADMTLMRVEIDVSERDVHRLRPGMPARITPDIDPETTYTGEILWIDPVGDYARATVQVKVRILEPGPRLKVGGSAKVEFLSSVESSDSTQPASRWLPKSCVKLTPGRSEAVVFTVIKQRAHAQPVTIGTRTQEQVEILRGLQPGMKIIADEVQDLRDGDPVRVMKQQ